MAEIIEINDINDIAPYRLAWHALLADTPGASFFHTPDWLELYWQHFGEKQKLRLLVVLACGKPIGIVPFCIRREKYRVGTVRVLTYPLNDWGTWFGPIGPNVAATMMMAMRHISQTKQNWDILEPRWADDARSDRSRTLRAMRVSGFRPHREPYQESSSVELSGNWETYWKGRRGKLRNNLLRAERQLTAEGKLEYTRYRPESLVHGGGDPNWEMYNACCDIAGNSWQHELKDGTTLTSKRVSDFLREAHAAAAKLGMVDMNLLSVDSKPIAFAYNYHFAGRVQGLRSGYDQTQSKTSAGGVLLMKAIRDSFERGDIEYDLGIGWKEYKQRFHTSTQTSYRFTHYRISRPKSVGVHLSRWIKKKMSPAAEETRKQKTGQLG